MSFTFRLFHLFLPVQQSLFFWDGSSALLYRIFSNKKSSTLKRGHPNVYVLSFKLYLLRKKYQIHKK